MLELEPLCTSPTSVRRGIEGSACWVCLEEGDSCDKGHLIQACACARTANRWCHTRCLARWQLQSAGTRKETHCEFCGDTLQDWKPCLTPPCGADAPAIMNVNFGGVTYSFQVKSGPEGYREFTQAICRAFGLPFDAELNITFTCDEPSTGSLLTLQGAGAYDAAVHCASISAARRMSWQQPRRTSSETTCPPSFSPHERSSGIGAEGGSSSYPTSPRHTVVMQDRMHQLLSEGHQLETTSFGLAASKHALACLGHRIRTALSDLFHQL